MSTAARPLTLTDAADELLAHIDQSGCGPEVLQALVLEAERLLGTSRLEAHSSGTTPEIRAFLLKSGIFTPSSLAEMEERIARGELRELEDRARLGTIAASYGESEVSEKLGVGIREVRYRARSGELYSFSAGGVTVYPRWQFADQTDDKLLPHLSRVLTLLLEDWDPASVEGFMTVPKEDLTSRGNQLSPVQWLLRGGNPRRIDAILEGKRWL